MRPHVRYTFNPQTVEPNKLYYYNKNAPFTLKDFVNTDLKNHIKDDIIPNLQKRHDDSCMDARMIEYCWQGIAYSHYVLNYYKEYVEACEQFGEDFQKVVDFLKINLDYMTDYMPVVDEKISKCVDMMEKYEGPVPVGMDFHAKLFEEKAQLEQFIQISLRDIEMIHTAHKRIENERIDIMRDACELDERGLAQLLSSYCPVPSQDIKAFFMQN
jgi:hypothetical protein